MAAVTPGPKTKRAQIQVGAAGFGVVFILVGIAGFIPGITTHYMGMQVAGNGSTSKLIGLFQVSVLHNLVHLAFGVAGLALAATPLRARNYLLYGGFVYGVFFFYGVVIEYNSRLNFIPVNGADDVLHFGLAAVMILASIVLDRGPGWRETIEQGRAEV